MEYRNLGRTGVKVSPLCLGAMMFGAWGEPDHDKSIRIIHAALDAGINFVDTADVYRQGENEEIVGKALKGRRDDIVLATKFHGQMGDEINHQGSSRRWIMRRSRTRCGASAPTTSTSTRSTARARTPTSRRRCRRSPTSCAPGKIRYFGSSTFPAAQIVEAQWVARERGLRALQDRAAAVQHARARDRGRRPPHRAAPRHGRDPVEPARRAAGCSGKYRKGADDARRPRRADRLPHRYDLSLPGNQRKFEAADALGALADEVGIPLIEIAIAFVINHPAVTSAIIGPRTMEHLESQLRRRRANSTPSCWTASTRSSRPRRASTTRTRATPTRRWSRRRGEGRWLAPGGYRGRPASRSSVWCSSRHRSAGSLPAPRSARPTGEGSEGIGSW